MSPAQTLLRVLQQNAFAESGQQPFPKDAYAGVVSQHRNQLLSNGPTLTRTAEEEQFLVNVLPETLPTDYENPIYYVQLHLAAKFLEEHFATFSKEIPPLFGSSRPLRKKVVLGTLPLESVNAMVYDLAPHDEVLICFRAGLFSFLDRIVRLVLAIIEGLGRSVNDFADNVRSWGKVAFSQDELEGYLRANPNIQKAFLQIVLKYTANLGTAELSDPALEFKRKKPRRDNMDLWDLFPHCNLMFVLGHEYGHLIAGHLTPAKGAACMVGGVQVANQRNSYQEELTADMIGEGLVESYLASLGMKSGEGRVVTAFCLSALDLLQRGMAIIATGYETNRPVVTHPPPFARRHRLQLLRLEGLQDKERVSAAIIYRSSKMLEYVLETLWHLEKRHIYHELKKCKSVFQKTEIQGVYPGGTAGLPYTPFTAARELRYQQNEKDTMSAERAAFKYGAMRTYLFLAPYAVAEGHATEAHASEIRSSIQEQIMRFLPPSEATTFQQRALDADELFKIGEKGLSRWEDRIQLAADIGSLVTAFNHLGHAAAERVYSGMAKRISELTFGGGYPSLRMRIPDDLRVWRAVSELCAIGVCGVVPSQHLKEECVSAVERYYFGRSERN